jgi:hypothetical protein
MVHPGPNGVEKTIWTKVLYVRTGDVRLFPPQSLFQEDNSGSLCCYPHEAILTLPDIDWKRCKLKTTRSLNRMKDLVVLHIERMIQHLKGAVKRIAPVESKKMQVE